MNNSAQLRLLERLHECEGFHDNSLFRLPIFRLLLYTSVWNSYTSNFCFSKSLFSSIPTSSYMYTMIQCFPETKLRNPRHWNNSGLNLIRPTTVKPRKIDLIVSTCRPPFSFVYCWVGLIQPCDSDD